MGSDTYLEHAVVETVGARLADELGGSAELVVVPVVLLLQDPQPLLAGEGSLEAVGAAHEVILRLVEDLFGLEDVEDGISALDDFLCVEQLLELLDRNV
jgi:hypothetical protein